MNRHLAVKVYASAAIFGAIAIFAAGATLTFHFVKPHAQASAWALTGVYVVTIVWAIIFTWLYWRRLDETAKEAQKFAWFYGALGGLFLTAPAIVLIRLDGGEFLTALAPARAEPGAFFALGWLALVLAQAVGFFIVWAGWWRAKR
jgi:hypothetical protein